MRHENETVKYTVKEVMKENEDLKESMGNMQTKMNKIQVRAIIIRLRKELEFPGIKNWVMCCMGIKIKEK